MAGREDLAPKGSDVTSRDVSLEEINSLFNTTSGHDHDGTDSAKISWNNLLDKPSETYEPILTKGNLTEATSSILTISGGTGSVIGSGTTIQVKQASSTVSGYLSSTDWSTFNGKSDAHSHPYLSNSTTSVQNGYFGDIYLKDDASPSHYLQITNNANLTANRLLAIAVGDSDRYITLSANVTLAHDTHALNADNQTITSGNGMNFTSGSGNITVTLGTPSSITSSSTNSVTTTSHTHAITGFSLDGHTHSYASNAFSTIAVSGQSDVVADSTADTLTFIAGTNVTLTTNATNDSVTINSTHPNITAATSVNNSGRTYIQSITLDGMGHVTGLASATETVTDTNYYPTTFTWSNGTTAGPTGSLTGTGMSAVSFGAIPSASETVSGIVTTGTQTIAGAKTFTSNIVGNITGNVSGSSGSCTGNSATATQAYTTNNIADILYMVGVTSATSGNQSLQIDASTYVTSEGYLYATRVYNAVYNDYAECFDNTDLDYDKVKNKIVEITDDDKVRLGSNNSIRVVGVVSDSYGHMLGGTEEEIENGKKIPVGIAGKLYVDSKDIVDINNIGKFVGSDDEGYAKVLSDDFKSGTVVGKIIGIDKENNRYKLLLVIK